MDEAFQRRYLGVWEADPEFDAYSEAWEAYFTASDEMELYMKHAPIMRNRAIVDAGQDAFNSALIKNGMPPEQFGTMKNPKSIQARNSVLRKRRS